ncbi:MAG: hypothetical protein JZU65_23995 [Chlorobium sp.]|nr:hypothetical protein [Chlorobium sp.]
MDNDSATVTLRKAVASTGLTVNDLLMHAGDQDNTLRLLCYVDYKYIWPETEGIPDDPGLNETRHLFVIPWYYMHDLVAKKKLAHVKTFQFPLGRALLPGALNVRMLLGGLGEFTLQEPYTIALPTDLEDLFFYKDELEKLTNKQNDISQEEKASAAIVVKKIPSFGGKKPGARASFLREAVEWLYFKLQNEGNTLTLQKGNISSFIEQLRCSIAEGNPNFSEYVAERIKTVKKPNGEWSIETHEKRNDGKIYKRSMLYDQTRISQILGELREKKTSM